MNEARQLTQGEVAAIYGKIVRRSFRKGDRKSAIHMVSVWACQNNMVLGQQKVNTKSNEITAILALLKLLEIKGSIITIDAISCQTAVTQTILDQGADCVLALKGNLSNLSDEVKMLFEQSSLPLKELALAEEGIYFNPDGYFFNHFLKNRTKNIGILGCNYSCYRQDMIRINGYDEGYKFSSLGDDTDLEWRFKGIGLKLKSGRGAANLFHLYHKRGFRKDDDYQGELDRINGLKEKKQFICIDGLDTH